MDKTINDERFEYYAFISYSHLDEAWACWIQNSLLRYRLPSVVRKEIGQTAPRRIHPVFRDATDLRLGRLKESLRQELTESRFLIVVCSPNSAKPNVKGEHWVNDEVGTFIELGRVDRIIPVIVAGVPGSPDPARECFPPAILDAGILGLDATKFPRKRILNDLVARILGLRPDVLWDRAQRETAKLRRRVAMAAAVVALIVGTAGLAAWDYYREKTVCYADYVEQFGIPQGLYPLSRSQVRRRSFHFAILSSRRRVCSVTLANSVGNPIAHCHTEYQNRPAVQRFEYDARGRLMRADHCDQQGRILQRFVFSGTGLQVSADIEAVRDESAAGVDAFLSATTTAVAGGLFGKQDEGNVTRSEISRFDFTRDEHGYDTQLIYRRGKNQYPACDADGVFGLRYERDEHGRIVEMWYLDENGLRWPNRQRVAGRRYRYNGANLARTEYVDSNGRPARNDGGWMVYEARFDEWGNTIEKNFLDAGGQPVLHKDGYAKITMRFDERGNITEQAFFDVDGQPVLYKDGYAKITMRFDERGNATEDAYFGVDGNPVLHKDGFAKLTFQYDERGNITELAHFGVDGNPVLHKDGFAKRTLQYDERGNIAELACFGVDGKFVLHKDGYAKRTMRYDERGNRTEEACFGVDGQPVLHKDGYAKLTMQYDERGNRTEQACFGVDGQPVLHKDGHAKLTMRYDERGNETERACFGVDGQPVLHKDGYAKRTMRYDERNFRIAYTLFDVDDKIIRTVQEQPQP